MTTPTSPETVPQANDRGYRFTPSQDWFSFNIDTWRLLFPHVKSPIPRVLEIGSWEGRSAVFLLNELCANGGGIVCIDHFDLMHSEAGRERYNKLTHNLSLTGKPNRIMPEFSFPALMTLLSEETTSADPGFDWIYVDGSHEADDTFLDGELAWRLARKGAIVIFDDYRWDKEPEDSVHHPKRGIDAFMELHSGEYNVLSSSTQYQMVLQKTTEMRIGFLVKDSEGDTRGDAFGYGIHVAMTVDSNYAMATAVALCSAVVHTGGRITVYIVDLGMTSEDQARIRASIPHSADVTILFLPLPKNEFASDKGATWAKIAMIPILPVERVLYIDADVLVRASLRELWNVDLKGNYIAAVTDVGYPMGHGGIRRGPYFNAGVLLMDLAKIREDLDGLRAAIVQTEYSKYRDQDALNVHFAGQWLPLDLKWNAQGMGTYAEHPSADRELIQLSQMQEPAIVHFTGPVHPRLEQLLNPYVQPYTSKPWGYAGAPGHPFKEEWWAMVEQTAWKGWRTSDEYRTTCERERARALREACARAEEIVTAELFRK
ncbi:glycosyltransferase family 8 protein [Wolfiporia cocos MD-104 SS10]|uniref:Glycosyltransferase family 8 protein n=1 Tax=Wolfiporia cocos (strain MD-104) TaxID=742152 RepID=A0A2H3JH94_WOLCO|nr:glycosyltransferase family 8 protein [Wolfiporia cocos MD-104 SS10]